MISDVQITYVYILYDENIFRKLMIVWMHGLRAAFVSG